MKLFLFSVLPFVLHFFPVFSGMGKDCYILEYTSSGFGGTFGFTSQMCWTIVVPEDMYVRLDIEDLRLTNAVNCSIVYMTITVTERNETYIYCAGDSSYQKPITASSNVTITVSHYSDDIYKNVSKFSAKYHTEDLICAQKNHFRCSRHTCIHDSKVCDGVEDCDNGSDEMECDMSRDRSCLIQKDRFGVISYSLSVTAVKCWTIEVPENKYVRLEIKQLSLKTSNCYTYLKIEVMETNETFIYCPKDNCYQKPIIALNDVNIKFSHLFSSFTKSPSSFSLDYHTEDLICAQKNHFRCSNRTCIHSSKVCNGVKDCENGSDEIGCEKGVLAVKGVNESRESTGAWLLKNRKSVGWGRKTHRAVTALFLAQVASFRGENLEEELMVKQLELQTSLALLRNSTDPLSVSELSMFVNALSVTCHNPRRFYGHDLLSILGERAAAGKSPSPGAYLTLCNSNWTLTQSDIHSLLHLLQKHSSYPFALDVQAVAVMALTCVKNLQTKEFTRIHNATDIYNATVEKFITGQLSDGSFGNVYTTALVTQALMASEQESNTKWNVTSTVQYLINQLNSSSVDFLSAYLALPIFSGRSLVDMAAINCANITRKQDKENEISEVTNKLGGKIRVQYSLYVGDQKEVIHSIYLRMPKKSSAYEIMRLAEIADPKYKFRHMDVSGHMYVYDIAGIINDPEAEKFWLMYSENSNRTVEHHTESPDTFIVDDEEHLIMWYKTMHVWNKR